MDARDIARSMGLRVPSFGAGCTARVGQYVALENGRYVDQSEKINAQRNKYTPKECARLLRR